jgi:large subunit ribosomal protein L2
MSIKVYKPTSSGRRKMSVVVSEEITKKTPEKSLLKKLKKHGGRDRFGNISVRHQGGGAKRKFRVISSLQDRIGISAMVLAIEYDPNRSANIALIKYTDGQKAYIIAPKGIAVDQEIIANEEAVVKIANRMKVRNIPTGISVYDMEITPGQGGKIARSAGNFVVIVAQTEGEGKRAKYVQVRMPSGEIRLIHGDCYASIGAVGNDEHGSIRIGKAGRNRWLGIRPTVRGKAMNPHDHPHGGGEGVNPIGLKYPKTMWGKHALGKKTRNNKSTGRFIIKRRK